MLHSGRDDEGRFVAEVGHVDVDVGDAHQHVDDGDFVVEQRLHQRGVLLDLGAAVDVHLAHAQEVAHQPDVVLHDGDEQRGVAAGRRLAVDDAALLDEELEQVQVSHRGDDVTQVFPHLSRHGVVLVDQTLALPLFDEVEDLGQPTALHVVRAMWVLLELTGTAAARQAF